MTTSPFHGILERLGARVRTFDDAENTVRPGDPGDGAAFVVEVQGLPNLLHELGHVLLHGRLERDHGTDLAAIPFSLTAAEGRRLLVDELVCCALSCRWHPGDLDAAHAWFAEQVGIQAVFYGRERDRSGFLTDADGVVARSAAALRGRLQLAEHALQAALREVENVPARGPRHALPFEAWWRRFRDPPAGPV